MPENDNTGFNDYVFPMEFISMEKRNNDIQDSVLLTCIQHLLSLSWPSTPKQPPTIDIGSSIENFIRNLISKNKLDNIKLNTNDDDRQNCQIPEEKGSGNEKPTQIDYNQFIGLLQTMLNKAPK